MSELLLTECYIKFAYQVNNIIVVLSTLLTTITIE